ncbi:Unknown (Ac43) [Spodoptera exigua multiple nucleopolyhedrovirus]|uniref:Ac43-like protein n=2 Tax=Spodoptera exigua multiple nucleopolyhedrovirus TaxID=10454 RepID=W0UXI6_9ABAC|nr:ORF113 [Spodoptera exigua multiple nucleopolyhedrovirus]AAF33642.1 ORF113 [Spodoptera exigua multiple nucleopolyhedrovirus]QKO28839.1 hypothetical protein [Spodoptera exigua multiple nucleopolyhedrovirus]UWK31634.1 hypothetical protein [Spodoptera exigua multiple nucleopolyhedrovirus]CDG72454.1 Unknown (Ac43) [Spodoptera exigua multiple nucleopolyhedrovirus]CDG72591.1 Unknown (Ac43) [Spodoptera exigua multiple nucleopolyhedrovirus]
MNRYSKCILCEEIVYLHKRYTNRPSDNFFERYRAVIKNNTVFCIICYKYIYNKRNYR